MVTGPDGKSVEVASPRLNAKDELMRVRVFYLDIRNGPLRNRPAGALGRALPDQR